MNSLDEFGDPILVVILVGGGEREGVIYEKEKEVSFLWETEFVNHYLLIFCSTHLLILLIDFFFLFFFLFFFFSPLFVFFSLSFRTTLRFLRSSEDKSPLMPRLEKRGRRKSRLLSTLNAQQRTLTLSATSSVLPANIF